MTLTGRLPWGIWLVLVGLLLYGQFVVAKEFVEGTHYKVVPFQLVEKDIVQGLSEDSDPNVQVLEFFSYACHWCYEVDPSVEVWLQSKPDFVTFQRVPVEFQPSWANLTKAYYTGLALGVLDKTHTTFFEAIHNNEITSTEQKILQDFFLKQGVAEETFNSTFTSFSIKRKAQWAKKLTQTLRIPAIPGFIIHSKAGTFWVSRSMVETNEEMLEVVDYLINKSKV